MEIKNLKKTAERIKKAVKNKENIILYGDADLDGASSVIILDEAIRNLGGRTAAIYFPNRETEGYGIGKAALVYLKKFSPALLVSLDCGIGNVKEVGLANKMKFEVIVVDHHEILDKLPPAEIIVDPKQKGDRAFKEFANAGITFKLAEALLGGLMTDNLRKNFIELAALATIADMMPRVEENEIIITEGLKDLEKTWRPGLKAFFDLPSFDNDVSLDQKVSKIIGVLNVRDVENRAPASFRLLTNGSVKDSRSYILKLLGKHEQRKRRIEEMTQIVKRKIAKSKGPIIFEGGENFDYEILGLIASTVCHSYKKPTFIYKKLEGESQGTVRMPQGIDSVALMKKCKRLLITYGGHPAASGFRVANENLEKFQTCLVKNFLGGS